MYQLDMSKTQKVRRALTSKAGQAALTPSLPGTGLCRIVYLVCFYYFGFVFCRVGWRKSNTYVLHSAMYQSKERGQTAIPGRGPPF